MPYPGGQVIFPPGLPPMMQPMMPFGSPLGAPPPRRSSAWRTMFTVLAVLVFLISIIANIAFIGGSSHGSRSAQQNVLLEGDRHQVIAVIPVNEVILQGTADKFNRYMGQAEHDPNVKAIVIAVETPGGAVTPSDEMYHRIDQFKTAHPGTPVVVSMGNLATSGGYYLSARADYIFAQPTTMTGNIGVLMPRYNVNGLAEKWGVRESTITAPKVGFKNAGSMFAPESEKETAYLQTLIDGAYKRFITVVKDGRGAKLKHPIEQIADGKVYLADAAKAEGLVDDIGFLDDAYIYAAKLAGLSNPTVVKYHDQPSLLDLLSAESKFSADSKVMTGAAGGGVTINGVNVNVDANLLDALKTPRVLYMWQGQ
jgi:protease-4